MVVVDQITLQLNLPRGIRLATGVFYAPGGPRHLRPCEGERHSKAARSAALHDAAANSQAVVFLKTR